MYLTARQMVNTKQHGTSLSFLWKWQIYWSTGLPEASSLSQPYWIAPAGCMDCFSIHVGLTLSACLRQAHKLVVFIGGKERSMPEILSPCLLLRYPPILDITCGCSPRWLTARLEKKRWLSPVVRIKIGILELIRKFIILRTAPGGWEHHFQKPTRSWHPFHTGTLS